MKNKVFFLGAGFSKALFPHFPLMNELSEQIISKLEDSFSKTYLNKIPPNIKENFEYMLTYLITDWPWKNNTTRHSDLALYSAVIQSLSDIFRELSSKYLYTDNYSINEIFYKFAQYVLTKRKEFNFITLNYDIVLEHLLSKVSNWDIIYNDFYKYPMSLLDTRTIDSRSIFIQNKYFNVPAILKLHGSSNWFWAGATTGDNIYFDFTDNQEANYDNLIMGMKPYIIPPVLDKNSFYNHVAIRALWQRAEQLLKQADEIYIVGFSFPPTDLSVRYLFQTALHEKTPQLYVVNIAKKEELKVYNNVFKGTKVNYDYTGNDNVLERFIKEKILAESSNE